MNLFGRADSHRSNYGLQRLRRNSAAARRLDYFSHSTAANTNSATARLGSRGQYTQCRNVFAVLLITRLGGCLFAPFTAL